MFKSIMTGKEIKKRNPNQSALLDDREYKYIESGKVTKGVVHSEANLIQTEQEKQEQLNQEEIQELNNWLDLRRNIEHPDKATKQARLLELLG